MDLNQRFNEKSNLDINTSLPNEMTTYTKSKFNTSIIYGSLMSNKKANQIKDEKDYKLKCNKPTEQTSTLFYSNYQKVREFFIQKFYLNLKLNCTNKKSVDDGTNLNIIDELKLYLNDLQNYLEARELNNMNLEGKFHKLSSSYLRILEKCICISNGLLDNAQKYDYNKNYNGNGYRSLVQLIEKCCSGTLVTLKKIHERKYAILFPAKYSLSTSHLIDFEAWCNLIEKLEIILTLATEMQCLSSQTASLFVNPDEFLLDSQEKILMLQTTYQKHFFGRTCCFQFCSSLKKPLTTFTGILNHSL